MLNDAEFVPDIPKKTIPGPVAEEKKGGQSVFFSVLSYPIFGELVYILESIC